MKMDAENALTVLQVGIGVLIVLAIVFVGVRQPRSPRATTDTSGELAVGIYGGSDKRISIQGTVPGDWRVCVFDNARDVENCVTVGALRGVRGTGNVLR